MFRYTDPLLIVTEDTVPLAVVEVPDESVVL